MISANAYAFVDFGLFSPAKLYNIILRLPTVTTDCYNYSQSCILTDLVIYGCTVDSLEPSTSITSC